MPLASCLASLSWLGVSRPAGPLFLTGDLRLLCSALRLWRLWRLLAVPGEQEENWQQVCQSCLAGDVKLI